jgi:Sensors of blue-light using FAD
VSPRALPDGPFTARRCSGDDPARAASALRIGAPVDATYTMLQLLYVSVAEHTFDDAELRALLAVARENNQRQGITGALMHQDGSFLQVLEGDPAVVDALFEKIGRDPRHGRVMMLARNTVETSTFPDWSMGFVDVKGSAALLPGFRRIGNLAGLVGDTRTIERILHSFRDGRWHRAA